MSFAQVATSISPAHRISMLPGAATVSTLNHAIIPGFPTAIVGKPARPERRDSASATTTHLWGDAYLEARPLGRRTILQMRSLFGLHLLIETEGLGRDLLDPLS